MKAIIVGRRNGKRIIRWSQFLALTGALALVLGAGIGFGYSLLAGQWRALPVLFGILGAIIVSGTGLLNGLKCPLENLTPLD